MYQARKRSQEKQRQDAAVRLSAALMEAVDETQYAVNPVKPFDLADCIRFILSKARNILFFGFVAAVLVLAFFQIAPPKYQATAKLYILENDGSGIQMSALQTGSLLLSDYREVFKTWEVHDAVRHAVGLDLSYHEMQDMLNIQVPSGSRLLYITVSHADPVLAAKLANAYAQAAHQFIVEELHGMQPDMFSDAIVPSHVSGLAIPLKLLAAFAAGMMIAIAVYVVFYCMDDRIRDAADLTAAVDAPFLASFPQRKGSAITLEEKEAACLLASQLLAEGTSCVLVTAPCAGAGVSFVCNDLLQALGALHRKALWIRVEHRPFWNQHRGKTLGDYLSGCCDWQALIVPNGNGDALFIDGTEDELPSQLFHPQMDSLMRKLLNAYDTILVDVPPFGVQADAAAFKQYIDGAVLVVSNRQTRLGDAGEYANRLSRAWPVIGTVFNRAPLKKTARFPSNISEKVQIER